MIQLYCRKCSFNLLKTHSVVCSIITKVKISKNFQNSSIHRRGHEKVFAGRRLPMHALTSDI